MWTRIVFLMLLALPATPQSGWILDMAPLTNVRAKRDVPLEFSIASLGGERLKGAQVEVTLAMADANRVEFRTTAKEIKAGDYRATVVFSRPGNWILEIGVPKGRSFSFKNKVEVKP